MLYLHSLFFQPPEGFFFASWNIGQINHWAWLFFKISFLSQFKFLNVFAVRISLLLLTLVFKIFTDAGLHKIRHSSLVCCCGFAFISCLYSTLHIFRKQSNELSLFILLQHLIILVLLSLENAGVNLTLVSFFAKNRPKSPETAGRPLTGSEGRMIGDDVNKQWHHHFVSANHVSYIFAPAYW